MNTKICKACSSEFSGRFCKICKREYLRQYQQKNKDRLYELQKKWVAENSEKVKAIKRKWKEAHPDQDKSYYAKNSEVIKARTKAWYENNKERSAAYKVHYNTQNPESRVNGKAKRRTRMGGDRLPYGTIPKLLKVQNGLCACCNTPLDKYHVDHIMPLALGGRNVPENVQLLSPKCNQMKSAKHPDVWKAEIAARQNPHTSSKTS